MYSIDTVVDVKICKERRNQPDATNSQTTFSTQCTQLATRISSITTATTGQTTIGSGTQLDLLMMGIKMPETC
jgi:hypothetical protein